MTERQPPAPLPTRTSDEPEIEPVRFVVRENAQGEQILDLVEGSFEQTYRIGGTHATRLFSDLCRSRGLLPYRHRRQHAGTICVRASLRDHDALWSQFLTLSHLLEVRLHEVTLAFVKEMVPQPKR